VEEKSDGEGSGYYQLLESLQGIFDDFLKTRKSNDAGKLSGL